MAFPNRELRAKCTRFLSGHYPKTQRAWLESLMASPETDLLIDSYNSGPAIARLEQQVAELLGKEAAIFIHKGVIAQQIALRVWADRTGLRTVALHPKSHIDFDEKNAYERLQNLWGVRVGKDHLPFTARDLEALHEPLGVITHELPLRRAGFKLLPWDELVEISAWAREKKIPLHFDGARLWESTPYYGRSLAEIAALADSVYVSFYKGLGGMGGCVLAGPKDFIEEGRPWLTRLGGNLYTAFPYVISALEGLKQHLPKMPEYCARAREIAAALSEVPGVTVAPDPPHTNAFQVYLTAEVEAVRRAAEHLAETERIWLFEMPDDIRVPGVTMCEIQIGEAAEQWETREIVDAIRRLLQLCR